jgi:hypothetical protein
MYESDQGRSQKILWEGAGQNFFGFLEFFLLKKYIFIVF